MVATWKTEMVKKLGERIKAHKVVGIVSIESIPSKQMQLIRKKISADVELYVTRSTIIKHALEEGKIKGLDGYLDGPCGLILSNLDAFKLEKLLYSNKTKAPAKAGSISPIDLIVPEGDTGLPAGPVIGDLQGAGVKAKIQGGTIVVLKDSVVVKAGDVVGANVAPVLVRLGIEPIDILLKLNAAVEAGTVYPGDVLHIDEQATKDKLAYAAKQAFNLSYNARIFTTDVVRMLVADAVCKARNLMVNAGIVNKETIGTYLARADMQAKALQAAFPADLEAEKPQADEPKAEEADAASDAEDKPAE